MPRFYFDVRECESLVRDEGGLELESLDAAEREAATWAADLGRDHFPKGVAREVTVEVKAVDARQTHGASAID
ncbi:DUF6894 family protein [Microvirga calopogonii]|uniref:DUF6894 family protein n=1 Tax=Microvirga calopogonii TaxID=2078013 RepID=UPI0013B4586B|nr:hypothetical protein [Microvirga calopogonii]